MSFFDDLEASPERRWHIDCKDRDPRSERQIVGLFRSRCRILCPAVRIVAIPNAAKRGQKAMNQARQEGAAWGFPDIMCLAKNRIAFIEFKKADGRLRDNQADWIGWLIEARFPATVARTPEAALEFLREHDFPFLENSNAH